MGIFPICVRYMRMGSSVLLDALAGLAGADCVDLVFGRATVQLLGRIE